MIGALHDEPTEIVAGTNFRDAGDAEDFVPDHGVSPRAP
jgi:hypothetical protein